MTTQYVTPRFSIHNAARFIANVESTNNTYYVFLAKPQPTSNEASAANLILSTDYLTYGFYNDMICGKRLANSNITRMIRRHEWAQNTVFTAYDHREEYLSNTNFYCTVNTGVGVEVFKCIWNNNGANSTVKPEASLTDAEDMFFELADGYRWKWLYTVGSANLTAFVPNSSEFVPVEPNSNVTGNAIAGLISNYVVEDGGSNFNSYTNGTFSDTSISGNTYFHQLESTASANNDFYKGCAIKITTGTGAGQQRTVSEYIGSSRRVLLDSPFITSPTTASTYKIAPNVEVEGDGQGAQAIAVMNTTSNTVYGVEITNGGNNYTWASVSVNGNTGIIVGNSVVSANAANVVAIISPSGGHGSNIYNELFAEYVGISLNFANDESTTISTDNDFHTIGIIANPLFANVVLGAASVTGTFTAGETVTQANTFATATVVSYAANALLVTNSTGRFVTGNSTYGVITGGVSAASAQVANITNNSQAKQFATFDQRSRLAISPITGSFQEDELAEQVQGGIPVANGYVYSANSTLVGLTNSRGILMSSDVSTSYHLEGDTSGAIANVTAVIPPDLVKQSGDLLYIENIIPISRGPSQTETLRFVFKL